MKRMNTWKHKLLPLAMTICLLAFCLAGCGAARVEDASSSDLAAADTLEFGSVPAVEEKPEEAAEPATEEPAEEETETTEAEEPVEPQEDAAVESEVQETSSEPVEETTETTFEPALTVANVTSSGMIDATELFSNRDLTQNADLSGAQIYTLTDGEDIHITAEGIYVLTGSAENVTVYVETDKEADAKVQLVLDGVRIVNDDFPCIYVTQADKVFVTTTDSENTLAVTSDFVADGDTNTDGVIFSKDDLVLGGLGTLNISSTDNGIVCKDDLKVNGGIYNIDAASKAFESNDSIRIADGAFHLTAGTDALHAENDDDNTLGYIYICGGTFHLDVGDDGIHANSVLQIDGGTFTISAAEGLEATYVQINDGTISIESWDDGINGAQKSSAYRPTIEITGGDITVVMASGDTDGIDCNGDLIITGGTIDVTGKSTFDCDGSITFTGGTVICNGQQVDTIPTQMMGGKGGRGGWLRKNNAGLNDRI